MHRSHLRSFTPKMLHLAGEGSTISTQGNDSVDTLINSATTLLRLSKEAPKKPLFQSSKALRLFSLLLHSTLVVIHLVLVAVWSRELEHRVVFSLENQKIVSFLITAITTTFGTIYSALLVFVTQTLSMRRDLQRNQTLTMTHDNAAAWAGIGSAVFQLWHQKVVPTSIIGIFSVFLYLGNILVLHITTPALFSLATFNSSSHVVVETQGLPAYNWSIVPDEDMSVLQNFYVPGSLYFLPYVVASNATNLGLHEGTLYDVLNVPAGPGNATVTATGFNITCGYLTDISLAFDPSLSWWGKDIFIANTEAGIISVMGTDFTSSIRLYSTIPIVDSDNNEGSSVELNPPMNTSVSSVQLLQCSQSLVSQTAVVDSQSRQIIPGTVSPEIEKASSMWLPYAGPDSWSLDSENITSGNLFLDLWGMWYSNMPASDFGRTFFSDDLLSIADFYLIQKLNLRPTNQSHPPENVTLHQLENALSTLVASMFWTLGHIPPIHGAYFFDVESQLTLVNPVLSTPPFPLQGDAIVTGTLTEIRLDLSIIAIVSGLVASTALTLLSLPSSLVRRGAKDGENITINGTGILHAIWLYRNHPELQTLLEQVEHPTNENLRDAGLVQIRLVGEQVRKQGFDSF